MDEKNRILSADKWEKVKRSTIIQMAQSQSGVYLINLAGECAEKDSWGHESEGYMPQCMDTAL